MPPCAPLRAVSQRRRPPSGHQRRGSAATSCRGAVDGVTLAAASRSPGPSPRSMSGGPRPAATCRLGGPGLLDRPQSRRQATSSVISRRIGTTVSRASTIRSRRPVIDRAGPHDGWPPLNRMSPVATRRRQARRRRLVWAGPTSSRHLAVIDPRSARLEGLDQRHQLDAPEVRRRTCVQQLAGQALGGAATSRQQGGRSRASPRRAGRRCGRPHELVAPAVVALAWC